jgi:hypothetical protein
MVKMALQDSLVKEEREASKALLGNLGLWEQLVYLAQAESLYEDFSLISIKFLQIFFVMKGPNGEPGTPGNVITFEEFELFVLIAKYGFQVNLGPLENKAHQASLEKKVRSMKFLSLCGFHITVLPFIRTTWNTWSNG